MSRVSPVEAPYAPDVAAQLERMMPAGVEPIGLFRTFVRNLPMAEAMSGWGTYELSRRLSLTVRDREILIHRTCALCRCEYEFGVHAAFFADRAGFDADQLRSLASGSEADACWPARRDRLLVRLADSLHRDARVADDLWSDLSTDFDEAQLLDAVMLCGWYHAISFAANSAQVEPEKWAPRFELPGVTLGR